MCTNFNNETKFNSSKCNSNVIKSTVFSLFTKYSKVVQNLKVTKHRASFIVLTTAIE